MYQYQTSKNKKRGISIIEILISIGIIAILSSVSVYVFARLAQNISLDRDANVVVSYIDKARTMSINSVDSIEHGVYFEANKVTVFNSTAYSPSNIDSYYDIPAKSVITSIDLTGGASALYFDKLTGAPNNSGTITLTSSDGTESKLITIYATGIVDIQ